MGTFVTALDQTVVITALPAIMADLKIPILRFESVIWMVTAYLLGYTAAMPLLGRLADVHGYRRVYLLSLAVFALGTTLVAVAGQWEWLNSNLDSLHQIIAARVIQAIGGGGAVPVSLAIAAALVSPAQRGLALGIVAGAAEAGSMLGPAYGGAVIELWGWRAIFWLNVPQAAAIAIALVFLRERRNQGARMDYWGAVFLTLALVLLCLAIAHDGFVRSVFVDSLGAVGGMCIVRGRPGRGPFPRRAAAPVADAVAGPGVPDGECDPVAGGRRSRCRHGQHGNHGQHGDERAASSRRSVHRGVVAVQDDRNYPGIRGGGWDALEVVRPPMDHDSWPGVDRDWHVSPERLAG